MSMDKEQAARKAAAKYSTNPTAAFVEYGKLTEQIDEHRKTVDELKKEMLGLLQQYRHPTNDIIAENMIFFGLPDGPEIYSEGHQDPEFLINLRKENIPVDLLKAVEKYVKEAELATFELADCKDELNGYLEELEKVIEIYNKNKKKRSDKRNMMVVQALGLTSGNAPKQLNKKKIYKHYFLLVRKKGERRYEAVKKIAKLNDSTSKTVIRMLNDYRRHVRNKWQQKDPQNLPTVEKWLKGFAPPNR